MASLFARTHGGSLELRIPGRVRFPLVLQRNAVARELDVHDVLQEHQAGPLLRALVGSGDISQRLAQRILQRGGGLDEVTTESTGSRTRPAALPTG